MNIWSIIIKVFIFLNRVKSINIQLTWNLRSQIFLHWFLNFNLKAIVLSEYNYNINLSDVPMSRKKNLKKCKYVFIIFQIIITG